MSSLSSGIRIVLAGAVHICLLFAVFHLVFLAFCNPNAPTGQPTVALRYSRGWPVCAVTIKATPPNPPGAVSLQTM